MVCYELVYCNGLRRVVEGKLPRTGDVYEVSQGNGEGIRLRVSEVKHRLGRADKESGLTALTYEVTLSNTE